MNDFNTSGVERLIQPLTMDVAMDIGLPALRAGYFLTDKRRA
jgi:hypothetical protein